MKFVYTGIPQSNCILSLNLIFLGFGESSHLVMYDCDSRRAMVMYIILWRESVTTNNTYYFLLHFFPLFQRIREASVAIIKRALAILQLFAIRWGWITLTISIVRRQGLLSFKLLIVCVLHFADQCSVFIFSVSLVVLENRYKTRLYRKLHLLLCLDTCKWPCFCLSFPVWKGYLILVSGHFARRSIRPMTVRPDFLVRSFHSFSVKLDVKRAFFFWLMVKERGILMSSTLVFARGLKTCEKFWLYCGTMWLWTIWPWNEVTGYQPRPH